LQRHREWDRVSILEAQLDGDAATIVALVSGAVIVEEGAPGPGVEAVVSRIGAEPPFRAELARRQGDSWSVGVRRIDTVELDPDPRGDLVEIAWDGSERTVRVDGVPKLVELPELGPTRSGSVEPYAATLWRLYATTWEIELARL
jgi:hypothetical protein